MSGRLERLSQVIGLIHQAGTAADCWPEALAGITAMLNGSRICLMDISSPSGNLLGISQLGHDPAKAKLYIDYYYAIDPTAAACLSAPAHQVTTVHELFPRWVRDRHEYFAYARSCDIGDVIGIGTSAAHGRRSILSLQRPLDAPSYGSEEKKLLGLLAPHIERAKRIQTALGQAWSAKQELEAAFGRLTMPAWVVDAQANIRHANSAAALLFADHPQVMSRHGKLVFSDGQLNQAFQLALCKAARDNGRSSAFAMKLGVQDPAELLVTPLSSDHYVLAIWQVPLAMVVIARPAKDSASIAWRMQQLYGLTPAEARVTSALALGQTVEEIAYAHEVTLTTLRSQLRSIFCKTGASRQAQLVRLALAGIGVSFADGPGSS